MKTAAFIILLVLNSSIGFTAQQINSKNWMNHPEISAIRQLYDEVENSIKAGKYTEKSRDYSCYDDRIFVKKAIFKNSKGIVQKYIYKYGSEDSVRTSSYYFDSSGKHRFTFAHMEAYNGTIIEQRIYYGITGNELYRDEKLLKGEGYFGINSKWVKNPVEHFKKTCEESEESIIY